VVMVDAHLHGKLGELLAQLGRSEPVFQTQDIAAWLFFPGKRLNRGDHLSSLTPVAPRQ